MRGVILLLLAFLAVGCLQQEGSQAPATESSRDELRLFAVCEGCHGSAGSGGTGIAPSLKNNEWVKNAELEEIKKVIREGRGYGSKRYSEYASTMPAWGEKYSEEEIELLARYIEALNS